MAEDSGFRADAQALAGVSDGTLEVLRKNALAWMDAADRVKKAGGDPSDLLRKAEATRSLVSKITDARALVEALKTCDT